MPIDQSLKAKRQYEKKHLRHLQRIQNIAPQFSRNSFRRKPLTLFQRLLSMLFIGFVLAESSRGPMPKSEKDPHFANFLNCIDSSVYRNHSAQNVCNLGDHNSTALNKASSTLSFFSQQQSHDPALRSRRLNKEKSIERTAREVCNEIYKKEYHFFNNPPGTTILTSELKSEPDFFSFSDPMSFSYPKNYNRSLAADKVSMLREYTDITQKDIWDNYTKQFQRLIKRFVLSEEMKLLAQAYFNDLSALCYLRLCSAYFEVFEGGNCNEISAHVAYKMLVAFHDLNSKEIPSIMQMTLTDRSHPNRDHAICAINLKRRFSGTLFFDSDDESHHKGFICDPWFHQNAPFIAMKDVGSHPMLSPKVHKYAVFSSLEVGKSRDLSSLPEELKNELQQLRNILIETPYKVPEEEQKALREVAQKEHQHPLAK